MSQEGGCVYGPPHVDFQLYGGVRRGKLSDWAEIVKLKRIARICIRMKRKPTRKPVQVSLWVLYMYVCMMCLSFVPDLAVVSMLWASEQRQKDPLL